MHYTNDAESRLALESLKIFREFDAVVGGACGFEPVGFVQLVGPEYRDALRRNVARQQALGIDTREVSLDDVRRVLPGVDLAGVGAAAYEPGSGFADPSATAYAFAAAARRGGATIQTHCEAVRVIVEGGRVAGVETTAGRVATRAVVIATARGRSRCWRRSVSTTGSCRSASRSRSSAGPRVSRSAIPPSS